MHRRIHPGACLGALLWAAVAWGHVPTLSDGSAIDADSAIELQDVQISRVFYHEITADAPQLWLTFEVTGPQALKLRLAVPVIERYARFRPAMALLGPGLPPAELPFEVPGDRGAQVFASHEVTAPEVYDEIFSGTQAWIMRDEEAWLPEAGRYYLVAYAPSEDLGRLWVALGVKEVFGPEDIATLSEDIAAIRAFHEVGPDAAPPCFLVGLLGGLVGMFFARAPWSRAAG